MVRPPVARVAAQDELSSALEALDEERAAPDGCAAPRVVEVVLPQPLELLACEHVTRQHPRKEGAPVRVPVSQHDPHRLRVDPADSADPVQVIEEFAAEVSSMREDRVLREDEVPSGDRRAVTPARLGTDG
jgi:hypothetical protein